MSNPRKPGAVSWGVRFLLRFLGLTGLLCIAVGGVFIAEGLVTANDVSSVQAGLVGERGPLECTGLWLIAGGTIAVLLLVLVESIGGLFRTSFRRSTAGLQVGLQVILATTLLIGVNVYSFQHYQRLDCTTSKQFTLPANLVADLSKLTSETSIIVYQRHKTFGQLSDKPDAYDYAAERKVVEKVRDLVAQIQELGPKFRVTVLDVEEEEFDSKLAKLVKLTPGLEASINATQENSIFFAGNGRVQRLSFNDFYQLDKTASKSAQNGKGNLVLLKQGVDGFARCILALEERRPRVGVAVIHEYLTTQGSEADFQLTGLRKSLEAHDFEVRDIVLKKDWGAGGPNPAAYTFAESKFDRLRARVSAFTSVLQELDDEHKATVQQRDTWAKTSLKEITAALVRQVKEQIAAQGQRVTDEQALIIIKRQLLRGKDINEEFRQQNIAGLDEDIKDNRAQHTRYSEQLAEAQKELTQLRGDERVQEDRRQTDVQEKFARQLAECDLLILPRMTIMNLANRRFIPPELYRLDVEQVKALRGYLQAGKPLLACLGPVNESEERQAPPTPPEPEPLEQLLADLGIRLGRQTVLYNAEADALAELRTNPFGSTADVVQLPPLDLEASDPSSSATPNPLRSALRVLARSVNQQLDLRVQYARPVQYLPLAGSARPPFAVELLSTSKDTWNEDKPFPTAKETPRFKKPKPDDPLMGTPDEKRRGPFPIGVALRVKTPAEWSKPEAAAQKIASLAGVAPSGLLPITAAALVSSDAYVGKDDRPSLRVVALGQGGLFVGKELSPAKEQLLLLSANWLVGRADRLPQGGPASEWAYPRVELSERTARLWWYGTVLGLPTLCVYCGIVMLWLRRGR